MRETPMFGMNYGQHIKVKDGTINKLPDDDSGQLESRTRIRTTRSTRIKIQLRETVVQIRV